MVYVPDDLAIKTRKLIKRFHEIKYYSDNFALSDNDGERQLAPDVGSLRKTSSVVFEKSIVGREKDKENILVYNDPRVCRSFDVRAWISVSDQFDVSNITRSIIVAEVLLDEMKGKKVLLVLDDVRNERRDYCWDLLCMPLWSTKLCKIVVTTRSESRKACADNA
uniref:NB-ARC domain-containing protein n=1 Tax=Oryza punctata TaxID=4537 RepID=A0A0E0MFK5_ORYPU